MGENQESTYRGDRICSISVLYMHLSYISSKNLYQKDNGQFLAYPAADALSPPPPSRFGPKKNKNIKNLERNNFGVHLWEVFGVLNFPKKIKLGKHQKKFFEKKHFNHPPKSKSPFFPFPVEKKWKKTFSLYQQPHQKKIFKLKALLLGGKFFESFFCPPPPFSFHNKELSSPFGKNFFVSLSFLNNPWGPFLKLWGNKKYPINL